jgi:hypothetical protein
MAETFQESVQRAQDFTKANNFHISKQGFYSILFALASSLLSLDCYFAK